MTRLRTVSTPWPTAATPSPGSIATHTLTSEAGALSVTIDMDALSSGGCTFYTRTVPPGAVQKRWSPSTGTWKWMARRITQADFAIRGENALDWGSDPGGPMSDLYLASLGGGTWDAWFDW